MKPEVYASPLYPAHLKKNITLKLWKPLEADKGWTEVWKWFNSAYDSLVATYQWMTMAMGAMKAKPISRTFIDVQSDTAMDDSDFSVGHVLKDSQAQWTVIALKGFVGGNFEKIMQEKLQMCLMCAISDRCLYFLKMWCPPAKSPKRRLIFHMFALKIWHQTLPTCSSHFQMLLFISPTGWQRRRAPASTGWPRRRMQRL